MAGLAAIRRPQAMTTGVDANQRAQVLKQMNKLINVLQAVDLSEGPAVRREMVLLRVRATHFFRRQVRRMVIIEAAMIGAVSQGTGLAVGLALPTLGWLPLFALGAFVGGLGQAISTPSSSHLLGRLSPPRFAPLVFSIKQTGVPLPPPGEYGITSVTGCDG